MTPNPIQLLIIDDHPLYVAGLRSALARDPDLTIAGAVADDAAARAWLSAHHADVALIDQGAPGWLALVAAMRAAGLAVIALGADDDQAVLAALQAGAATYLVKAVDPAALAATVRRVARSTPRDMAGATLFQPLSERELAVLAAIVDGHDTAQIGVALGISAQTVKNHISSILHKLSLPDRTTAVLYALRRGWVAPPG